ncbi:HAD family hydrolase [Legionella fallonii]|uniref:HAD-superfamily hydrolase n=1 Tax=Legionella fallonii LLAP-10 TaxID=1212491 RepID=A0A098G9V4_9GAMM|nr:HAD family phosphatase [Legionella fallonii]CEG58767.1 HAD-superfamily hydrolase [Legionella fallonii LLAP-10]
MKYKAIIFDFDGVLFDSEPIHLQAYNEVLSDLGFNISEKEYFQRYVGLSDKELFSLLFKDKDILYEAKQINTLMTQKVYAYKAIIDHNDSLEGLFHVHNFIRTYVEKVEHFAICSGATREEINATLNKLDNGELKKYFKHIVTIDDVSKGKPSPEGYLLTARHLDIHPQYCLAIEDTPKGASAAKNAGMSIAALTSSLDYSHFNNVDLIAQNYDDIDHWIKSLDQ